MAGIVEYCPGDAPGSPAYLDKDKAEIRLIVDTEYCYIMEGVTGRKYQLPHMGGECSVCRRKKEQASV